MYSVLLYISIFVGVISFICCALVIWAKFWRVVPCTVIEKHAIKININGKEAYFPKIKYKYFYADREYVSSRVYLLGGRSFSSKEYLAKFNNILTCYVCPVFPEISFLRQEKRLVLGFFGVILMCMMIGFFIETQA